MARLKMVGIINKNEITKYQKYNTNKKMTLINNDKDNIQIKAIPICVFLIILCNVVLFLKLFNSNISIKPIFLRKEGSILSLPIFLILGFLIGCMLLIVHEILHGIVYPKNINVSIGFIKPITFVALASYPMSKSKFIIMCLLPFILGIIPMLIFTLTNNSAICSLSFGMMCMGIISPYPDVYNVFQIIKKVPKGKKVLFYEETLSYID